MARDSTFREQTPEEICALIKEGLRGAKGVITYDRHKATPTEADAHAIRLYGNGRCFHTYIPDSPLAMVAIY